MKASILPIFLATLLLAPIATAQNSASAQNPIIPTITFELYWEAATPQNFTITADSSGKATYVSRNPTRPPEAAQQADPNYEIEFTMSAANRNRIFQLAAQANYFNGDFDYKQHLVANT